MITPYFLANKLDVCRLFLGIVVAIAESLATPVATIIIGRVFREIQNLVSGDLETIQFMHKIQTYTYCLVGIAGYSILTGTIGYILWMGLGYKLGHEARTRLYKVLIQRKSEWFDEKSNLGGLAMMHYKDIQDIEVAAGTASFEIVSMFAGCIVEIGVAFYFSWAVTLVCLAGIPILIGVGSCFSHPITRRITASKSLLDKISERTSWVLVALQTVKLFQREKFEWMRVNLEFSKLQKLNSTYRILFSLQEGICRTLVLLIFMQGFYFGSYMVREHHLNAGNVVTVFWSCLNASALLQTLISHLLEWNKGRASAERLSKVLTTNQYEEIFDSIGLAPDIFENMYAHLRTLGWKIDSQRSCPSPVEMSPVSYHDTESQLNSVSSLDDIESNVSGRVLFNEVVFSYPSRPELVFTDLSMNFPPGTTTFVLGHSGSGKSSLAGLLTKQYPYQAGEVSIDGHDIHLLSRHWIDKNVYICEQNPNLFDISLRENIKIGSIDPHLVSDQDLEIALKDSCAEFVYDLPDGLNTLGSESLSGGQQQRVALARARVRNAPIMLFDEVTSALDPILQTQVFAKILSYRQTKTTIIITHDLNIIPEGYPIYVLANGKATYFPAISEVKKSESLLMGEYLSVFHKAEHEFDYGSSNINELKAPDLPVTDFNHSREEIQLTGVAVNLELFRTIPNKWLFTLGMVITALHAGVNPVFSFVFSKLLMGILDPVRTKVTLWAMLVLTFAVLDGILSFNRFTIRIAAEQWLRTIRIQLFDKLLSYPGPRLTSKQVSYYNKLLVSDTEKTAEIIMQYWPALLSMVVLGSLGFIWAFAIGWKLTLAGVSLLPVFVAINQMYKLLTTHWTKLREAKRSHVIRLMMDLTSERGFRTVKVQNLENYFKNFYFIREKELHELNRPMLYQIGVGYGILKSFPYALESLLLWYGMKLLHQGSYTAQQTMSIFTLLMFTVITIDQLTSTISSVGTGFEALRRLMNAINKGDVSTTKRNVTLLRCPAEPDRLPTWETLNFYRVGITYPDGTSVLGNFTEEINHGETVALVGPSGIGKSTIGLLLERLEAPTSGEIIVDKKWDLQSISTYDVRQNIALVGQAPLDFFDGTIEENLLYGLIPQDALGSEKMIDVCKSCGAHEFITSLKEGYSTRIKAGLLSGGQMQRLGIARVLIRRPKILILDECTSALDVSSTALIKSMIETLKSQRRMIIIIITHQMDVAATADRIIAIR